jgi:DNA-binding winged helix-turn-helix (wHTH) protein
VSESAVSTPPAADPVSQERSFRRQLGLCGVPGFAQSLASGRGTLLSVVPVGADHRLAIVGYLLPLAGFDAPGPEAEGLVVDTAQHRALVDGRDIDLVHREFELLAFLAARPCQAFTRAHLLASVWGRAYQGGNRTVDVHMHRLRRKLGPEYGQRLVTMRRLGYLYRPPWGTQNRGS